MATDRRSVRVVRATLAAVGFGLVLSLFPAALDAQYFGRNKVQYQDFDFQVLSTEHFDIHYYPEAREPIEDAARMAERWYTRLSRVFNHEFNEVKPLILYANHPDFQQTNVTEQILGEGTGGFAESTKNRVVLPLTGVYRDSDHVLGHEIVHAFQYDIAQRSGTMGQQTGLGALPLWLIEGMAEYLSVGREDPNTAMWLRDAALRGDLPTFRQLTMDPRFFPYRYGQALWAYIGGRWGDRSVTELYKAALREGWDPAVRRVLRVTTEELNDAWMASIRSTYLPLMQGKERPEEVSTRVVAQDIEGGRMNTGPSLSPDGRWIAYFSERDLFEITLFLADAHTGEIVQRLMNAQSDAHMDALSFLNSAGAWSPDGSRMAFTVFARGNEELAILRIEDQEIERRIAIRGVGAVSTPAWSPDGRYIALSGNSGGVTDLYLLDVETQEVIQLTDDRYAALQPTWSPDGSTLAYVTDRFGTDLDRLDYGEMRIALMDVETREITELELFAGGKHIDPKFSPDGRWLYFVSDADGFTDVYRTDLATTEIERITRLATGVSGVSAMSPALTMAAHTGDIMFSVFSEGNQAIYRMDAAHVETRAQPESERYGGLQVAGILPPEESASRGIVASYLEDPLRGLPDADEFAVEGYSARLALDYIGVPTVGVAMDRFGTFVGGSVATFWSDMLGNRQLFAAVQANGGVKDIGGQAFYQNRSGRINWGAIGGHIPYQLQGWRYARGNPPLGEAPVDTLAIQILRIFENQAMGVVEYPLSQTRRWEFNAGYMRYGFDLEERRIFIDRVSGRELGTEIVGADEEDVLGPGGGDAIHLGRASVAYVGDWSNFGFTSPVRGGRFRFELSPTVGTWTVANALADYRRYFYNYPFTLAVRGLHYGRYGPDAEESHALFNQQLFLGHPTLVRGYSYDSFSNAECRDAECTVFTRLIGSRIGVASAEVRVPLFGVPEYGLLNFPFIPTELSAFVDAGLTWTSDDSPVFAWDDPTSRTPVVSAGLSSRFNLMGFAVFEVYYAYPFQRPDRGFHFGFNLAPGW